MNYIKNVWVTGDIVTADKLNNIEDGIEDVDVRVGSIEEKEAGWDAKSDFSGDYNDLENKPTIPSIEGLATKVEVEAIEAEIDAVEAEIDAIEAKIPAQATSQNKLADRAFVNSSVQTATANFRGNWDSWADVPSDSALYPADYAGSKIPTTNDYLVVKDASDYRVENPLEGTWRFKYSGVWETDGKNGWNPEYQVNESPMTADQLAAINSGITEGKVDGYDNHVANAGIHVTAQDKTNWDAKQNAINANNKLPVAHVSGYTPKAMVVTYDDDTTETFNVMVVSA